MYSSTTLNVWRLSKLQNLKFNRGPLLQGDPMIGGMASPEILWDQSNFSPDPQSQPTSNASSNPVTSLGMDY